MPPCLVNDGIIKVRNIVLVELTKIVLDKLTKKHMFRPGATYDFTVYNIILLLSCAYVYMFVFPIDRRSIWLWQDTVLCDAVCTGDTSPTPGRYEWWRHLH